MKIENQDALKKWLVKILNPIFEGDSDKLALYIVALAKKVENDEPSRQRCIDDLEVFLESNTNTFVDNFFDALFNKTYLQSEVVEKTENETKPNEEKKFDQRRLSDTGSRVRSRLSRDYQEIDVSNRPNRASSHGRRRKNRSRTRLHGASRSSSSSSYSPSPVRRSRSRSNSRSRSRSPGQITEPKKQRCKDFYEKGYCEAANMCPYEHEQMYVARIPPGQMSINVQSSQHNTQFGQKRRVQMNKNGQQQRYQKNQAGGFNQRISSVNMQGNLNDNLYIPSPIQQNQQGQPQMQRQVVNTNRPRNLVNIVTSLHEDDTEDQSQQRGLKRTRPSDLNNGSFNNNNYYDVNNDQFQQQQQNIPQQQALLPTPNLAPGQRIQPQFQQQPQQQQQTNTTLILRKIPNNLNTPDKMRQHFSKFGTILEIECRYDNLNDAAMIKFSSNTEAFAAYRSPQPVFNNRFIRLYWLSSYLKQQQQQNQGQQTQQIQQQAPQSPAIGEPSQKRPAKERLSFPGKTETETVGEGLNKENLSKPTTSTLYDTTTGPFGQFNLNKKRLSAELSKSGEELAKKETPESLAMAKQIQEENKKKAVLLKLEVQKKARELMEQQLKDQKILMAKLEQAKTVEEKNQILILVKKLSQAIDKEKEILNKKVDSLESDLEPKPSSPTVSHSPFTFQKSTKPSFVIPPVHQLKINNKRLNTTSFLKAGANKLVNKTTVIQASTAVMSNVTPPSLYTYSRVSVDNRPKQLMFSGVENQQEKTNIVNFISSLGCQIEAVEEEKSANENQILLIINFATRRDAEVAITKCMASLTSKKISISWHRPKESGVKVTEANEERKVENESVEVEKKDETNDSLTSFLTDDIKTDEQDNSKLVESGQTDVNEDNSNVFDSLFNDKE